MISLMLGLRRTFPLIMTQKTVTTVCCSKVKISASRLVVDTICSSSRVTCKRSFAYHSRTESKEWRPLAFSIWNHPLYPPAVLFYNRQNHFRMSRGLTTVSGQPSEGPKKEINGTHTELNKLGMGMIFSPFFDFENFTSSLISAGIIKVGEAIGDTVDRWWNSSNVEKRNLIKSLFENNNRLRELKEFVEKFNEAKSRSNQPFAPLFSRAISEIDFYRAQGKLTPRKDPHPNIAMSSLGFITLTECEDHSIRYEAFTQLKRLLKQPFNPLEETLELLILEQLVGDKLKDLKEETVSFAYMLELVTCYNLILSKLFLNILEGGTVVSHDTKFEIRTQSKEVAKKLLRNPAFQYEAQSAKVLGDHLHAPNEKVRETVRGIANLLFFYPKIRADISYLFLEDVKIEEKVARVVQYLLSNKIEEFQEIPKIFDRLKQSWVNLGSDTDVIAFALILKEHRHTTVTKKTLEILQNAIKSTPNEEKNWVALYRLVEVLFEITRMKKLEVEDAVRFQALEEVEKLIDIKTPSQVLYKIGTVLLQLQNDYLIKDRAKKCYDRHLSILEGGQRSHLLRSFARAQEEIRNASQRLRENRYIRFSGKLKDCIDSLPDSQELIPQDLALDRMVSQFQNTDQPLPIQIIYGTTGGGGKKTLAATYAKDYAKDYRLVHWVDAQTFDQDMDSLADVADIPKVASGVITSLQERKFLLRQWLEEANHQGWLLIIDNVYVENCQEIKNFLPSHGGHVLIITNQPQSVKSQFSKAKEIKMQPFTPAEASHYILGALPQDHACTEEDRTSAEKLCKNLCYLPLALSHAKAFIKTTGYTIAEYLRLSQGPQLFKEVEATTLSINLERCKVDNPFSWELLKFMVELDGEHIHFTLIQQWWTSKNLEETKLSKAIQVLKDYVIVEGVNNNYSIKPYLQVIIKKVIQKDCTVAQEKIYYHEALIVVRKAVDKQMKDSNNWSKVGWLMLHCEKLVERQSEEYLDLISCVTLTMGKYYFHLGDFNKALEKNRKALEAAKKYYQTDEHVEVATCIYYVGIVLKALGRYQEARVQFEESLRIRRIVYKEVVHIDLARTYNNLGSVSQALRDFKKAEENHEKSLEIFRKIPKPNGNGDFDLNGAWFLNRLGRVLLDLIRYDESKKNYEESLSIYKKIHKTEWHPDVARTENDLGRVLKAKGDLNEAEKKHNKALLILRTVHKTEDHPEVAKSLNHLGTILEAKEDWVGAKEKYEEALAIYRNIHKTYVHPDIAWTFNALGVVLAKQGKLEDAKKHFQDALAIRRNIYSMDKNPEIPESVICLNNLGDVLKKLNDSEGSRAVYEESLNINRKMQGFDKHLAVVTLENLGKILEEQKNKIEAESKYREAIELLNGVEKDTEDHAKMDTLLKALARVK